VEGEVSFAVAGGAGGDGDEVTADGRGAGFRVQRPGQGARRADQVLRHDEGHRRGRRHWRVYRSYHERGMR
jgi:hypothetical protein